MMPRRDRDSLGRWQVVEAAASGEWHIVPTHDSHHHERTSTCWCQPLEMESVANTWVHQLAEPVRRLQ